MQRVVSHHATRSAAHNPLKGILFGVGLLVLSLVLPTSAARAQCTVFCRDDEAADMPPQDYPLLTETAGIALQKFW